MNADSVPENATDVIVVGAGVVGLLISLELAHRGLSVRLIDKSFNTPPRPQEGDLMQRSDISSSRTILHYSLKSWRTLEERLGVDAGLAVRGGLELATSEGRTHVLGQESNEEMNAGEESRIIGKDEAESLADTEFGPTVTGARWAETNPTLSTTTALENLRQAVIKAGVIVWGNDTVTSIIADAERVYGVRTSGGEECLANHTILTSGSTAANLLETADVRLPLRPARHHLLTLSPKGNIGFPLIAHRLRRGFLTLKRTRENYILLSYDGLADPTQATYSFQPDVKLINALRQHAGLLLPALQGADLQATTITTTIVTPDYQPAIGPWTGRHGLVIATGFADRSFAWAAGIARLLTQQIMGEPTDVDIGDLIPQRFAIGMWQRVKAPKALEWPEGDDLIHTQYNLVGGHITQGLAHDIHLVGKTIQRPTLSADIQQVGKTVTRAGVAVPPPQTQERQKIGRFQTAPIKTF